MYKCSSCGTRFLEADLIHTKCSENYVGSYINKYCPLCMKKKQIVKLHEVEQIVKGSPFAKRIIFTR
jgi:hypothetical protein